VRPTKLAWPRKTRPTGKPNGRRRRYWQQEQQPGVSEGSGSQYNWQRKSDRNLTLQRKFNKMKKERNETKRERNEAQKESDKRKK
jgi:hypothetical protein